MRYSTLDALLLAIVGTLTVHELVYLPGSVGAGVAHDHMPALWGIGGAIAVAVTVRLVVRSLRTRAGAHQIDPLVLGSAIAAFFTVQEAVEFAIGGSPAITLLSSPIFLIGVALAPAVGYVLARFVNSIAELAAAAPAPSLSFAAVAATISPGFATEAGLTLARLRHQVARRGPPALVLFPTF